MTTLKHNIKYILFTLTLTVFSLSCSKKTPAGFWINFHKDLLLTKISNQGPWGGHREINWKSDSENTFTEQELIDFAQENDWILVDSVLFSSDTLSTKSFIKLKSDDYSLDILKDRVLSKLNSNDNKILIFKTTWLAVEPGNTRETFKNGFVVLNSHGTELKVYHLWGE